MSTIVVSSLWFQQFQTWIWQAYSKIRPNVGVRYKPKFARWEKKNLKFDNNGSILDRDSEDLCWDPYATNENDDLGNHVNGR